MKKLLLIMAAVFAITDANSNNIVLSNVALNGQNSAIHSSMVNFDVTWDNSWRTSTNESNYDGAWIFVKYRKANTSEWKHASLDVAGFTSPSGATVKVSTDNKGLWIYRNANGTGTVNFVGAKIRWNYGIDGVADNDSVEVKVFAMEMVYIPQGAYYLGSGGTSVGEFRQGSVASLTPYLVNSAGAITVGNNVGDLFYTTNVNSGDGVGPIPATFPNGFNAFWLMKYEASQQQMADFINHLDQAKATLNNPGIPGTFPNFTPLQPERPAVASWKILKAYADWSGMRPFTELEYEKACRGANISAIPNEYAWGNTSAITYTVLANIGTPNEIVTAPPNANCNFSFGAGTTTRCGIFATATSTREGSGAGYYGNMELSGNLFELVISTGSAEGRAFTGAHGDGSLDATGVHNVANWPALGKGERGGDFYSPAYSGNTLLPAISNRSFASDNGAEINTGTAAGYGNNGIRLARTGE